LVLKLPETPNRIASRARVARRMSATGNQKPTGTKEYIGGTGKYAGLTGHATFTLSQLKTIDEDSSDTWEGHAQGTYKLGTKPPAQPSNGLRRFPELATGARRRFAKPFFGAPKRKEMPCRHTSR
jgi:hypothetical protein